MEKGCKVMLKHLGLFIIKPVREKRDASSCVRQTVAAAVLLRGTGPSQIRWEVDAVWQILSSAQTLLKSWKNFWISFLPTLRTDCLVVGVFPALMLKGSSDECPRQILYPAKPDLRLFIPVGQCSYVLGIFCLLPVRVCEQHLHLWEPHCGEHAVVFSFWLMVLVLHHLASDRLH